uniref:Uncharacterized protein n=1 Tax=Ananas comosus var. bracteatus TaxID=296719 RepID=A0A6V7P295_ANACO|nr:unnamed protein product [Ananas comosus var. bracteatus]
MSRSLSELRATRMRLRPAATSGGAYYQTLPPPYPAHLPSRPPRPLAPRLLARLLARLPPRLLLRLESGGLDNNVEIVTLKSSHTSLRRRQTVQPNTNGEAKQVETSLNGSNSMHLENEKQTDLWKRPRDESVEENCDEELGKCFELVF